MSKIKWYKKGEFKVEKINDKLTIVKLSSSLDTKYNFRGFNFYIGYINGETFDLIYDFDDIKIEHMSLEIFKKLNYTEIINIKLGYVRITSTLVGKSLKYLDLMEKFENNIEFYK